MFFSLNGKTMSKVFFNKLCISLYFSNDLILAFYFNKHFHSTVIYNTCTKALYRYWVSFAKNCKNDWHQEKTLVIYLPHFRKFCDSPKKKLKWLMILYKTIVFLIFIGRKFITWHLSYINTISIFCCKKLIHCERFLN